MIQRYASSSSAPQNRNLESGQQIPQSKPQAPIDQRASEIFQAKLMLCLGRLYEKDKSKIAWEFYSRAAKAGLGDAYAGLAYLKEKGLVGSKDLDAASKYYLQAMKLGSARAHTRTAYLHEKGRWTAFQFDGIEGLYEKGGTSKARYHLALMNQSDEAFDAAITAGHPKAYLGKALMHERRIVSAQSNLSPLAVLEMIRLYSAAVVFDGSAVAALRLAYWNTQGIPGCLKSDDALAKVWSTRAEASSAHETYRIGKAHFNKRFQGANDDEAAMWLARAVGKGSEKAAVLLAKIRG